MPARSGPTRPLEVSELGLLSNCGCGLIALSAGFLDCFRPERMGHRAALSGLASGNHLGSEVESRSWSRVGDPAPSTWPGEQMPWLCSVLSGCRDLRGRRDESWFGLAAQDAP